LLRASGEDFSTAANLAANSFEQRPDVRVGLYQVNWWIRAGETDIAMSTLQSLERDYGEEIAASADLSARLQFLQNRLQIPTN